MLAIGRGLMSNPKLMLLDEPSMGLSPIFVAEIFEIIQTINKNGTTVLLVEQNAKSPFPFQTEPMFSKPARLPLPILPRTL